MSTEHKYRGNVSPELEEIYDNIVKKFPDNRVASYLISRESPFIDEVIGLLQHKGYFNSDSKIEADHIIIKLLKLPF